jgi:hypothetical protein
MGRWRRHLDPSIRRVSSSRSSQLLLLLLLHALFLSPVVALPVLVLALATSQLFESTHLSMAGSTASTLHSLTNAAPAMLVCCAARRTAGHPRKMPSCGSCMRITARAGHASASASRAAPRSSAVRAGTRSTTAAAGRGRPQAAALAAAASSRR